MPGEIFSILRGLCETPQRYFEHVTACYKICTEVLPEISAPNGLSTLRDIVTLRPPLRQAAMGLLLDMTTHPGEL